MKRTDLTHRLNKYRRMARGVILFGESRHMKTLATLTAAGGAALVLAHDAHAAIQSSGPVGQLLFRPGTPTSGAAFQFTTLQFDLDVDGNNDFVLGWGRQWYSETPGGATVSATRSALLLSAWNGNFIGDGNQIQLPTTGGGTTAATFARNFSAGSPVPPDPVPGKQLAVLNARDPSGPLGNFQAGEGIVGVQFTNNTNEGQFDSASSYTHYGWIKVDTTGQNDGSVTVVDWAYETTPNAAIAAAAVPEPGTFALCLLGMGAAGVQAWRRRKKAALAGGAELT
jgi:hypothetical protein